MRKRSGSTIEVLMLWHTKGPWRTHGERGIEARDNDIVAMVEPRKVPDEQRANQRLIAAAPDMFSALLDVERMLSDPDRANGTVVAIVRERVADALDLARGR